MEKIIHRADSRGVAEHGWLSSRHTFSFANYYNPERMSFGKLRVLNDDVVDPAGGFGTHSHDNMEIVSVPLSGALRHQDSMGNKHVIQHGEVQIMSAGTGLSHSEYNNSDIERVNFLQIWVLPKEQNIQPCYGQLAFDPADHHNEFQLVVSPEKNNETVWINQEAYFSLGDFEQHQTGHYTVRQSGHGIYLFVIDGAVEVAGETLNKRDAIGIVNTNELTVRALDNSQLLIIEVPMY